MSADGSQSAEHSEEGAVSRKGPLAWMAQNSVAANLLMLIFIVGGLIFAGHVKQEVFPEVALDIVNVSAVYPGASPQEVEQGVVLAVEEAVRGLDGVKSVRSTSREGQASVQVEGELGYDVEILRNDVESAVARITSFPEDVERPVISVASNRQEVVTLIVHGEASEWSLRDLAESAREGLLTDDRITLVELSGVRPYEVSVEIDEERLRQFELTHDQVAGAIRAASVDLPGGGLRTAGGEVLVRTTEQRDHGAGFEEIVIASTPDGNEIRVRDLGVVHDGFRETDQETYFDGDRAALVKIFRVGNQTPIEVADAVKEFVEDNEARLPVGVSYSLWNDQSEIYRDRIDLLVRNARLGLILVLLILGIFLEVRLAFWVTLGIPISFLGAFLFMPAMDVSINMISLFAFILTLGIVVDDAIVVGEAVYKKRREGLSHLDAAIAGAREVAVPVTFAIITTVVAFTPMMMVPGVMGKLFGVIPAIVIPVFLISLFESLLILPAHLAHAGEARSTGIFGFLHRQQQRFSDFVERVIEDVHRPLLEAALSARYLTFALALFLLAVTVGIVAGGRIGFAFMPSIESDVVTAQLEMPFGTPVEVTREIERGIVDAAQQILEENGGADEIGRGILSQVGSSADLFGGPMGGGQRSGSHIAQVAVFMVSPDERPVSADGFVDRWRELVGEIPGAESLKFVSSLGPSSGAPIDVELTHQNVRVLEDSAEELARRLSEYAGVFDVDDGFSPGKEQLDLHLTAEGRSLGITEAEMARQIRGAFFGSEAVRQQRGREELRVYVRRPLEGRDSEYDIETFLLQTPGGGEIPLGEAATIRRGRAATEINRKDGRRIVSVTADVDDTVTTANDVVGQLTATELPQLMRERPGLSYAFGGEQEEQREAMGSLMSGFQLALLVMFGLMAIAFRSYIQPLIVMLAIPFGFVGAVAGHLLLGYGLSMISMMGLVALAGVAVNDSLVLVDAVNSYRRDGLPVEQAVVEGGLRRFRPVLLTSLTTFFGLAPMILETSMQARFLIPMAISLGFGVIFATVITLLVVPSVYLILEDIRRLGLRIAAFIKDEAPPEPINMDTV